MRTIRLLLLVVIVLAACGPVTPTPTLAPTQTQAAATPTATAAAAQTPPPTETAAAAIPSATPTLSPTATPPAESVRLEIAAQTGGAIQDMLIKGNLAYIAQGARLVVLDVSNPADPKTVGQTDVLPVPALFSDLFFVGDGLIYWPCGLIQIIDVHDPAHPALVKQVPWDDNQMDAIVVKGSTAYFFEGLWEQTSRTTRIHAVDLADPLAPKEVGVVEMEGFINQASLFGDKIYAFSSSVKEEGLLGVVDLSDPQNLQVTMYPTPFKTIIPDLPYGLTDEAIYDLTNPASIQQLSKIIERPFSWDHSHGAVAASGLLYIINAQSEEESFQGISLPSLNAPTTHLAIIDYRDPKQPKMITGNDQAQAITFQGGIKAKIGGSILYVMDARGLSIIDIKDPARPHVLKQIWVPKNPLGTFDMVIHKGVVYYADRLRSDSLYVYDFRDPALPRFQGLFPPALGDGDMFLAGQDTLYVSLYDDPRSYLDMRWHVVDISHPEHPRPIKDIQEKDVPKCTPFSQNAKKSVSTMDVFFSGNLNGPGQWVILDTSQPLAPCFLGALPLDENAYYKDDIVWDGSHLYVLADDQPANYYKIKVFDPLSHPGELIEVGSLRFYSGGVWGVKTVGDNIYLEIKFFNLNVGTSIYTLDRTDPTSPQLVKAWEIPAELEKRGARFQGFVNQYAIMNTAGDIFAIDLTNPAQPVIAGSLSLPMPILVEVVDGQIYATDLYSNLYLIQLRKIE